MKSKALLVNGILAAGGLALAYFVWTDEDDAAGADEVTLFECDPDSITRVELHEADEDTVLEIAREGDDPSVWIQHDRHPPEGERTSTRFIGSRDAIEYLSEVAPFRARRSLGELDEAQLESVGLDEPEGTVVLRCGERNATFSLGGRAFGEGDRYVRAASGGPVYLVASGRLSPLETAETRLMQRALHTFEWTEVEAIRVRAYDREKRLLQRNRLDPRASQWVDAEAPDRRNELYGNWFLGYPRIRVQRYLDADARPGADLEGMSAPGEDVLRIEFYGEGESTLGFAEMQRVAADPVAYYVRTETTRGWVRVPTSVAQSFAEDLRPVLGLDPVESAVPTPTPAAPTEPAPTEPAPTSPTPTSPTPTSPTPTSPTPTEPAPAATEPAPATPEQ